MSEYLPETHHARYKVGAFTNASATFVLTGEVARSGLPTAHLGRIAVIMAISNIVLLLQGIFFNSWWTGVVPAIIIDGVGVYYIVDTLRKLGQDKGPENSYFPGEYIEVRVENDKVTFRLNSMTSFSCPVSAISRIERRPLSFIMVYLSNATFVALPRRAVPSTLLALSS